MEYSGRTANTRARVFRRPNLERRGRGFDRRPSFKRRMRKTYILVYTLEGVLWFVTGLGLTPQRVF